MTNVYGTLTLSPLYGADLTLTANGNTVDVELGSIGDISVLLPVLRGPKGDPGTGITQHTFGWDDASPATVVTCPAGKQVYSVELSMDEAFNGAGAQITVGDAGDPARLMPAAENDPTRVGAYSASPAYRYSVDTPLLLTLTPGSGNTQGRGLLIIEMEQ